MAAAIGNYARKTASASKPAQLSMRQCDVNMRVLEATKPVHGAIDDESHVEKQGLEQKSASITFDTHSCVPRCGRLVDGSLK